MRKLLVCLSLWILCLTLPVMALAMTQTEWNQQCRMKTTASITLYQPDPTGTGSGELATGTDIDMRSVGTLPADTYIKSYSYDSQLDMRLIGYYSNGGEATAFIRSNSVTAAVKSVQIDDGDTRDVPEALADDIPALLRYLANEMPGYTFTTIAGSKVIHKEKSTNAGNGGASSEWWNTQQSAQDAADQLDVDEEELPRAIVYAPRTGKASLRQRAAGNGKVIDKLVDGTIVYVVKEGKNYTQVLYNGMTGYIITSALEMVDPEQKPIGLGMITHNGKVVRNSNINVRSDGTGKGRKIDEWPTGTEVIVWSLAENGEWYEIEYDGLRVWIQAKFLTITEPYEYDENGNRVMAAEADEAMDEDESLEEDEPTDEELNG